MATQKDDIALRKAALLKAARSAVRLKHSIAADYELNNVLPALESSFDADVLRGILPEVAESLRNMGVLHDAD
jgi:hypothetical protein